MERRTINKMMLMLGVLAAVLMRETWAFYVNPRRSNQPLHFIVEDTRTSFRDKIYPQLRSTPPGDAIWIVVGYKDDDNGENSSQTIVGDIRDDDDEDEEDDPEENMRDSYVEIAKSEFYDDLSEKFKGSSSLVRALGGREALTKVEPTTRVDWGGALGRLRDRVQDIETGESQNPSKILFRLMSSQSPSQAIGNFVSHTNPQVVQAMSNTVNTMLGGLSNPMLGVEMIVKASGEKVGSLCFQLQMTGYMFRNVEYVLALKEIMDLHGSGCTLQDYKNAFDKLDKDGSGYIEASEVKTLMDSVVYKGKTPQFEIEAFVKFFDQDRDGKVSWEEFQRGLGVAIAQASERKSKLSKLLSAESTRQNGNKKFIMDDDDDDDEDKAPEIPATVSGTIEIEMEDGEVIEMDAAKYIESLKKEAQALKAQLRREKLGELPAAAAGPAAGPVSATGILSAFLAKLERPDKDLGSGTTAMDSFGGIANYINSRQGDMSAFTEGISPEIVETMKLLVDYVLEGGESGKGRKMPKKEEMSMEIPASALRQLALWQLVLGYRLREAEAKGDYLHLLKE